MLAVRISNREAGETKRVSHLNTFLRARVEEGKEGEKRRGEERERESD